MRDALPRRILDSVTHVKETPNELKKAGGLVHGLIRGGGVHTLDIYCKFDNKDLI
jgi:hypothetical protein